MEWFVILETPKIGFIQKLRVLQNEFFTDYEKKTNRHWFLLSPQLFATKHGCKFDVSECNFNHIFTYIVVFESCLLCIVQESLK